MTRGTGRRHGRGRDGRTTARALDAAAVRGTQVRELLRAAALAALAALALGSTACSGGDTEGAQDPRESYENEAPARGGDPAVGESDGETDLREMPGGGAVAAARVDQNTRALPGTAGSGTAASGWPSGSIGTPGSGVMGDGPMTDASVQATLDAMHRIEAGLSQLGAQKAQHPAARQYAEAMIAAHRPKAGQTAPRTGDGVSDLLAYWREMDVKTRQLLTAMPAGPAFDVAFVNAQVQAHEASLQTLDRLESDARAPELTRRIRAEQESVAHHLTEARALQSVVARAVVQPGVENRPGQGAAAPATPPHGAGAH